jgi:hypothetical protein
MPNRSILEFVPAERMMESNISDSFDHAWVCPATENIARPPPSLSYETYPYPTDAVTFDDLVPKVKDPYGRAKKKKLGIQPFHPTSAPAAALTPSDTRVVALMDPTIGDPMYVVRRPTDTFSDGAN